MQKVNLVQFDEIINNNKLVVVDFYADWCGPCKMMAPVMEQFEKEREDVIVLKVNVDEVEELNYRYGITSIPSIIFIKDGKAVKKEIGYRSCQNLIDILNNMA